MPDADRDAPKNDEQETPARRRRVRRGGNPDPRLERAVPEPPSEQRESR